LLKAVLPGPEVAVDYQVLGRRRTDAQGKRGKDDLRFHGFALFLIGGFGCARWAQPVGFV